jgi:hypothetical protein
MKKCLQPFLSEAVVGKAHNREKGVPQVNKIVRVIISIMMLVLAGGASYRW